jgi:hypothetical protein
MFKILNFIKNTFKNIFNKNEKTIFEIIPTLYTGWVAMDKTGTWYWYKDMPFKYGICWVPIYTSKDLLDVSPFINLSDKVKIKPYYNWEQSLIEIKISRGK